MLASFKYFEDILPQPQPFYQISKLNFPKKYRCTAQRYFLYFLKYFTMPRISPATQ